MSALLAKYGVRALLVAVALLAIGALFTVRSCQSARTARTTSTLATGQTGAALASGADAANTIGNRMDADATSDTITRENDVTIRNAQGAEVIIAAPVRDAGLAALCRRVAYKDTPRCAH